MKTPEEDKITSIKIHKLNKKSFRKHEIHPRETDEDIILRLMKDSTKLHKMEQKK